MIIYEWIANLFIFAVSLAILGGALILLPAAMDIIITWYKKRS